MHTKHAQVKITLKSCWSTLTYDTIRPTIYAEHTENETFMRETGYHDSHSWGSMDILTDFTVLNCEQEYNEDYFLCFWHIFQQILYKKEQIRTEMSKM